MHVSYIGLVLIAAFYAIAGGALVFVVKRISGGSIRWIVGTPLAVAIAVLPWIEEASIAWSFRKACANAKLRVNREVRAEGFLDNDNKWRASSVTEGLITNVDAIRDFDLVGFRFVEYPIDDGSVLHKQREKNGLRVTILQRPLARYAYGTKFRDAEMGYGVLCSEEIVTDLVMRSTVATYRHCRREGSALTFNPYPIEFCPSGAQRVTGMLYSHVLNPAGRRQR